MQQVSSSLKSIKHLITGMALFAGCALAYNIIAMIEVAFFPVKDMKSISSVYVVGDDLWVSGKFRKIRDCAYITPVRGTDLTDGHNLYIVSHARAAGQNWQSNDIPIEFGPWQVVGGGKSKVKLYQEYRCWGALWPSQFDPLFEIDSTDPESIKVEVLK